MPNLLEQPASGRRWGWLQPIVENLPQAKRFTATSIACPNCGAGIGEACPGPRVHPGRIENAISLARQAALPELGDEPAPPGATDPVVRTRPPGRPPRRWNDSVN